MNDRAIHHVNNGQHQQSQGAGVQQSPPTTTTTGSPVIEHPTPTTQVLPSATPTSRISEVPYMALFGKEYECLIYERRIAAWKLSIEKQRLELCASLNVEKKKLESYARLSMSPSQGKPPPLTGPHRLGAPVPFPGAPCRSPGDQCPFPGAPCRSPRDQCPLPGAPCRSPRDQCPFFIFTLAPPRLGHIVMVPRLHYTRSTFLHLHYITHNNNTFLSLAQVCDDCWLS